jgi:hypothetical protein
MKFENSRIEPCVKPVFNKMNGHMMSHVLYGFLKPPRKSLWSTLLYICGNQAIPNLTKHDCPAELVSNTAYIHGYQLFTNLNNSSVSWFRHFCNLHFSTYLFNASSLHLLEIANPRNLGAISAASLALSGKSL